MRTDPNNHETLDMHKRMKKRVARVLFFEAQLFHFLTYDMTFDTLIAQENRTFS